jgi:hypothetical protein
MKVLRFGLFFFSGESLGSADLQKVLAFFFFLRRKSWICRFAESFGLFFFSGESLGSANSLGSADLND